MSVRIEAVTAPRHRITFRRDDLHCCWPRDQWLVPEAEREALARPVTRRLLVDGVGHYLDREHGHIANAQTGMPYTAVFVCVRGSGWIQLGDGKRRPVPAGSALLIPKGVPTAYGPTDLPWSIWWCTLAGSDSLEVLQSIGVSTSEPVVRVHDVPRLVGIIDEMASIYERNEPATQVLEAAGIAWKLITRIGADRTLSLADPVEKAKDYLDEHFDEWVPVPELASRVGLSHSRLTELFRIATGYGVLAYQIQLRMSKARLMLEETDESVADIARQLGYSDPYYFSRHFRRVNGLSPSHFRLHADAPALER
jgi:AraC-like DNA-binding protein